MKPEIKYNGETLEDTRKMEKLCYDLMSDDLGMKEASKFIDSLYEKGFATDEDNSKIKSYYHRFITFEANNDFNDMCCKLERLLLHYFMFKGKYNSHK